MPRGVPRSAGWIRVPNASTAGVEALGLYTEDPAARVPYVFGKGACDTGRIATSTRAGSAITFPDAYSFGEAIELRYTFAETGNSQRQGLFLETRQNAANSATVRGAEFSAAQCGAVAIGVLEGANIHATARSTSTGNITSMYGVTGEANFNSAAYTGTVATIAAVRGKLSMEDGATYTNSSVLLAEAEAVSGNDVVGSIVRGVSNSDTITASVALDFQAFPLTVACSTTVTLMKFCLGGTVKNLNATACGVSIACG